MRHFFIKHLLFLYIILANYNCLNNGYNDHSNTKSTNYADGTLESRWTELEGKKNGYFYKYYKNGNLMNLFHYKQDAQDGEQYWFYENGELSRKIWFNLDHANGMAYYFYHSGNLSSERYFKNDVQSLFGSDYWDQSFGIRKASLYFNDSGSIYFKKNFDTTGKLISEEGKRPNNKDDKVK